MTDLITSPYTHPHADMVYKLLLMAMARICKAGKDLYILSMDDEEHRPPHLVRTVGVAYTPPGYYGTPVLVMECYHNPTTELRDSVPPKGAITPVPAAKMWDEPSSGMQGFLTRQAGLAYERAHVSFETVAKIVRDTLQESFLAKLTVGVARARGPMAIAEQGVDADVVTLLLMLRDESDPDDSFSVWFRLLWNPANVFNDTDMTPKESE